MSCICGYLHFTRDLQYEFFYLSQYILQFIVYSPFWAKTIYDSLKFIAGISEIYIVFLFIVLLYKLTKVNRLGITIFVIVVLLGVTELQNIFIQSIS